MRIDVATEIDAPVNTVWEDVRHLASHVEWMHDAVAIRFTSTTTEGVGTTFDCDTKVGPLRTTDRMEVTAWEPGAAIGVRHVGLVTGVGRFTLTPLDGGARTCFAWHETLQFPRALGGEIAARAAKPVLRAVWRRNLRGLAARFARGAVVAARR